MKNHTKNILSRHIFPYDLISVEIHIYSKEVVDFSEEKISNHIEWYTAYLSLREKQKKALEEWRQNKAKKSKSADVNALSGSGEKKNNIHLVQRQNVKEKISKWKVETTLFM